MKQQLRSDTLRLMKQISKEQRDEWQASLLKKLLIECQHALYKHVAFYYGFFPEVETLTMIKELQTRGIQVYLPRILPQRQMSFHLFEQESDLEVVQGKIYQPKVEVSSIDGGLLDVIIVPGVVFSTSGERIGFGGGYYDRYLAKRVYRTISLVLPVQLRDTADWEVEETDIKICKLLLP